MRNETLAEQRDSIARLEDAASFFKLQGRPLAARWMEDAAQEIRELRAEVARLIRSLP